MYQIEITDTFGGEANYCWVKRWTVKSERQAILQAAAEIRSFGCKRTVVDRYGDGATIRPPANGPCVVAFVSWVDE